MAALNKDNTMRFRGAPWFEEVSKSVIMVGGVGGIGSNLVYNLSRLSPQSIIIFDDDCIEKVNMAGQLFCKQDIGSHKVDAIATMVNNYSDYYNVLALPDKFKEDSPNTNLMFCGFDNMEARKIFYNSWKNHVEQNRSLNNNSEDKCLFLDGRLSCETFQVLCIQGNDTANMERYEKEFLFSDKEATSIICSYKQTTFMAMAIASYMTNLFVNFMTNQAFDNAPVRPIPFFNEFNGTTLSYNCQY